MSAKTSYLKLGLFTTLGLGLLLTGILAFGAWSSFERKTLYESYFPGEVSGLAVGSAVEFRGVHVGKVSRIGFSWKDYQDSQPGLVVVVFEMKEDLFAAGGGNGSQPELQKAIERGLRARLKTQGITGTCIMSLEYLDPVENPPVKFPWKPSHPYVPSAPGLLGDLLVSMQKILHNLERLDVAALNQLAQTDLKSVGAVLDRIQRVDFENLSTNAVALLQDIRRSTGKIDTLIDDTDGTVKTLPLQKLATDADALVAELRQTVKALQPGVAGIDFDSLNQTLARAREAIKDIDDVLNGLKQYPSGFIFGAPPPRLKQVRPAGGQAP